MQPRVHAFSILALALACSAEPDYSERRPWSESSARIELRSFGYWEGSTRFEADRDQLTPSQLGALEGLRQIPTPKGPVGADFTSYRVQIIDAEGGEAQFRAAQDNITDSDERDPTLDTLDVGTLAPFLETLDCITASETRGGTTTPAPEVFASAPTVPERWKTSSASVSTASRGCFHGVFVPNACHDVWIELQVDAPGTYQLSAVDCFENLELTLFSPEADAPLASVSGSRGACPSLEQSFAAAGSYPLLLRKTNAAGCSAIGVGGDFFFNIAAK